MAVIQAGQIDGLIKTTLPHIVRDRKASIAERLTKYVGAKMLFQDKKVTVSDGTSIQWNMTTDHANTAMQVGLFDTVAPATNLHQVQGTIPWRHTRAHVSWDLREVAMNRSEARILNYVKEKIFEMDVSWWEHLETQFWGVPAAGDDQSVFGVSYWNYSPVEAGSTVAANANWGVNGAGDRVNVNLTAFTGGPGAISRVTYPRAANWYQNYANVTYSDLFRKMRVGFDEIEYETPVNYNKLTDGNTRFGIYCRMDDALNAADEARLQNENVGPDLAFYDGKATVRGTPVMGVPKLSEIDKARATAIRPFYVLDWSQLRPYCLEGFAPYETTESGGGNQPLTVTRLKYMSWNMRCWNGKTLAIFTTV